MVCEPKECVVDTLPFLFVLQRIQIVLDTVRRDEMPECGEMPVFDKKQRFSLLLGLDEVWSEVMEVISGEFQGSKVLVEEHQILPVGPAEVGIVLGPDDLIV